MSAMSNTKLVLSNKADADMIDELDRLISQLANPELKAIMPRIRNRLAKATFVIEVDAFLVGEERQVTVYEVELFNGNGAWHEAFGSRDHLEAFLTGLKACCGIFGMYMPNIEIPRASD